MKTIICSVAVSLACALPLEAQHHPAAASAPPALEPAFGRVHHPIATSSAEAQQFFDQGLALVYGFNHEEAIRAFRRAAELDPKAAMPLWGIALALGPNINMEVDAAAEKAAYDALQQAVRVAAAAPPNEHDQAYIAALSQRYSDQPNPDLPQLARAYADAMRDVSRRYPDDLDAATLFAESLMDLRPWKQWTLDGKPAEETPEILAVLESVLRRDPSHLGANHYYIHATEASPSPERALPSAGRLATLAPASGHLVHMPAHVFVRTGDYESASTANAAAAAADERFMRATGATGMYTAMYYNHNIHFLAYARSMQGRYADAKRAADDLLRNVAPAIAAAPMLEAFVPAQMYVLLRFARWNDILAAPPPPATLKVATAIAQFARGVALAATGRTTEAEDARGAFEEARKQVPPQALIGGTNPAGPVLELASIALGARLAAARAQHANAVRLWRDAVAIDDRLAYDEPPPWYQPAREALGAALLRVKEPREAERIFREDLDRHPRSGRSLFGLWRALVAQNRPVDAAFVQRQFEAAWKDVDTKLRLKDY